MFKNRKVFIDTGADNKITGNVDGSKLFLLTAMAKSLGASEVDIVDIKSENYKNGIVIKYYSKHKTQMINNAKYVYEVYWCDLNKALTLENIWKNGNLVGWMEYKGNSGEPKGKLLEEYGFFDTKFTNHDFTLGEPVRYINNLVNQHDGSVGEVSDGYHTFDELYNHRLTLFSVICNQNKENSWKSLLHDDGTMYDNYFIVGIDTPEGQFTYHYHVDNWELFNVKVLDKAPKWDRHKSEDVIRLRSL